MNRTKIDIMQFVDDNYILECAPTRTIKKKNNAKKIVAPAKMCLLACASFLMIISLFINIFDPAFARGIPFVGSAFSYIQDNLDFTGLYTNYAFEIGETATCEGLDITLSEAYCDGNAIFISYAIKSNTPYALDEVMDRQFFLETESNIKTDNDVIDLYGLTSLDLQGSYLDEYTFVGAYTYFLDDTNLSDDFILNIKIKSAGPLPLKMTSKPDFIEGTWKFSIPIILNLDDTKTYGINARNGEYTIDKIEVSPIVITIYTSYPDIYGGTVDYSVFAYSKRSKEEFLPMTGTGYSTYAVMYIPRKDVEEYIDIYVLDAKSFDTSLENWHSREAIENISIVSAHVDLE